MMTSAKTKHKITEISVKKLTITALLAAMITLMTGWLFHIPVGGHGGYIHLGDMLIYLAACILPLPYACAAGVIGGGLADLMTAPVWAPATMIIKALLCIPFTSKGARIITGRNVAALVFAGCITVLGYFVAEGIMYGFTAAFLVSATGNIIQAAGSGVAFFILGSALDKMNFKRTVWKEL